MCCYEFAVCLSLCICNEVFEYLCAAVAFEFELCILCLIFIEKIDMNIHIYVLQHLSLVW